MLAADRYGLLASVFCFWWLDMASCAYALLSQVLLSMERFFGIPSSYLSISGV